MLRWCVLFLAACQGDPPPPPAATPEAVLAPEPGVLRLMGTGAMAPLARRWAQAFHGSLRVVVEPSVGSGGGVRAAADGAVDLGMISRPLDDAEKQLGLERVRVGRDVVMIAGNHSVPVDNLRREELAALYAARSRQFSDGSAAVMLIRDAKESANAALERVFPELTPLREEVYRTGRLRVLYHDDAMEQALATTPGALGEISLGALVAEKLPLKPLSIDGVHPSDDKWQATRELALVLRPDRRGRAAELLAFIASPEGRRILGESGYLP